MASYMKRRNTVKYYLSGYSSFISEVRKGILKLSIFTFITLFNINAQDVQFTASAPSVVAVGEQFRLIYSLNSQGTDLRLPDLGNFQLVSGPSTSSSSSVQIINGQMTQTRSVTYNYILRAAEVGNYVIGPATITSGSDQYVSN